MAQQLNLFDARFAPAQLRFSARHGGLILAAVLVGAWGLAQGLHWAGGRAQAEAATIQAGMAPLRTQLGSDAAGRDGGAADELARLRAAEATQRRVRAALEAGAAGAREGHADVLLALARQASGRLWITGLGVSDDGGAIDLEGRMTDSSVLTDYLRRLNDEPRFKGRPFAQLTLRAVDNSGGALPYTEFALRSTPAAGAGQTP
jgi:hypothetical protein